MTTAGTITLRLTIPDPLPGVAYSLQDKKSRPVDPLVAGDGPVSFDLPVRIGPGPKFYGEHVRSEGPTRRFVYIAIGVQAGQHTSVWSRRAKIDIHQLSEALLADALAGGVLEALIPGRDKDGGPACATLAPLGPWRLVR